MSDIQEINKKLDTLTAYIYNDDKTGRMGLVQQFDSLKQEFEQFKIEYEKAQAIKKAKIGIISAAVSIIATGLIKLISLFV